MGTVAPVYLIGSERSGTNFLRTRLTLFQSVYFGPAPAHFLKNLYYNEPYYRDSDDSLDFGRVVDDALSLCYVHFSPWEITLTRQNVLQEYSLRFKKESIVLLAHFLMEKYAEAKGYKSYFCKDNNIFDYAYQILRYLPEAKFIYLCRDPRDYALSQYKRTMVSDSYCSIARLWKQEQRKCISLKEELGEKCVFWVSYEDLLRNEKQCLTRLCEFLNVPKDHIVNTTGAIDSGTSEEWGNLGRNTMTDNFNKYKQQMSDDNVKAVESVCWKEMRYLGYVTEFDAKPSLSRSYIATERFYGDLKYKMRILFMRKQGDWAVRKQRAELLNRLNQ